MFRILQLSSSGPWIQTGYLKPRPKPIADADHIVLSSISIWEIGIKVQKEKLFIPVSVQEFTDKLEQIDRLDILPVDVQTWLKPLELTWDHRDPADRTIVATASLHACALVTSDSASRAFYSHAIKLGQETKSAFAR